MLWAEEAGFFLFITDSEHGAVRFEIRELDPSGHHVVAAVTIARFRLPRILERLSPAPSATDAETELEQDLEELRDGLQRSCDAIDRFGYRSDEVGGPHLSECITALGERALAAERDRARARNSLLLLRKRVFGTGGSILRRLQTPLEVYKIAEAITVTHMKRHPGEFDTCPRAKCAIARWVLACHELFKEQS